MSHVRASVALDLRASPRRTDHSCSYVRHIETTVDAWVSARCPVDYFLPVFSLEFFLYPSQYSSVPSIENPASTGAQAPTASPFPRSGPASVGAPHSQSVLPPDASPAAVSGPRSVSQAAPCTPASLDLQSPPSNASSYHLQTNLRSVEPSGSASLLPEANALVVNILLNDSLLNLFKDENFDSCTMCSCNSSIRGADVGLYLPDRNTQLEFPCMCGFSAVVNRKYAANSGLFYEDEVAITEIRHERYDVKRKPLFPLSSLTNSAASASSSKAAADKSRTASSEALTQDLVVLLQQQFTGVYPPFTLRDYCDLHASDSLSNCSSCWTVCRTGDSPPISSSTALCLSSSQCKHQLALSSNAGNTNTVRSNVNLMELLDACEACYSALEAGKQAVDSNAVQAIKLEDSQTQQQQQQQAKKACMHVWPFINSKESWSVWCSCMKMFFSNSCSSTSASALSRPASQTTQSPSASGGSHHEATHAPGVGAHVPHHRPAQLDRLPPARRQKWDARRFVRIFGHQIVRSHCLQALRRRASHCLCPQFWSALKRKTWRWLLNRSSTG